MPPCKWFCQPREEFNTVGGYIHKPRREVFGPWHCPLGGEAMHSLSSQLGQTHSEAWGWGPGCGLPDVSLRSAEGWTGSLDSVNNGRDRWMERWKNGRLESDFTFWSFEVSQVGTVQMYWRDIKGIAQHFGKTLLCFLAQSEMRS